MQESSEVAWNKVRAQIAHCRTFILPTDVIWGNILLTPFRSL